jgi:hypothetical protein
VKVVRDIRLSTLAHLLSSSGKMDVDRISHLELPSPDRLIVIVITVSDDPNDPVPVTQTAHLHYHKNDGWKIDEITKADFFFRPDRPGTASIKVEHDFSLVDVATALNRDPEIVAHRITAIDLPFPFGMRIWAEKSPDVTQRRGLVFGEKSGWRLCASGGVKLRIIHVERVKQQKFQDDEFATQWEITTELTNTAKEERLFLAVPYYGASVNGKVDYEAFVVQHGLIPVSHGPIFNRFNDFVTVPAGGKLVAKHVVSAIPAKEKPGQFVVEGSFVGTVNVPEEWKRNNFPAQWRLTQTPVGKEFEFRITLMDCELGNTAALLGTDFDKFWRGEVRSNAVKLKIVEAPDKP